MKYNNLKKLFVAVAVLFMCAGKAYASGPVTIIGDLINPPDRAVQTTALLGGLTGQTTSLVAEMELIRFALNGGESQASVHSDLITVGSKIEGLRRSNAKIAETQSKERKYYAQRKVLGIGNVMENPDIKARNCQDSTMGNTISPVSTITQGAAIHEHFTHQTINTRSESTRNSASDNNLTVSDEKTIFCSKEKFKAGLCLEPCQPTDTKCSPNANSSTDKFLDNQYGGVYQNDVEARGAKTQISLSVDPYPNKPADVHLVKNNPSADVYIKGMLLDRINRDLPVSIESQLFSERVDIGDTKDAISLVNKLDVNDSNTMKVYKLQAPNADPKNKGKLKAGIPEAPLSKHKILEMMVASEFNNPVWEAKLSPEGAERYMQLGKALALNNKLLLKMYDRLTEMLLVETRTYSLALQKHKSYAQEAKSSIEQHM